MRRSVRTYLARFLHRYGEHVIDDAESDVWIAFYESDRAKLDNPYAWLMAITFRQARTAIERARLERKRCSRSLDETIGDDCGTPLTLGGVMADDYGEPTFLRAIGTQRVKDSPALRQHLADMERLRKRSVAA